MAEEEVKGRGGEGRIGEKYYTGAINRTCGPAGCGWQEEEVVVKSVTVSRSDIIK